LIFGAQKSCRKFGKSTRERNARYADVNAKLPISAAQRQPPAPQKHY
jgi:hypothetical protein